MKNHRGKAFIAVLPTVATILVLSACGSNTAAPLNLPTPPPSSAKPSPTVQPTDTIENAGEALASSTVDPNAIQVGSDVTSYSEADMKAAYRWVTDFIPLMFQYTGYWNNGLNASTFTPTSYWVFSNYVEKNYWDSTVSPRLLGQAELEKNRAMFESLGPLPPRVDGYWSVPAVTGFKYEEPVFSQGDSGLIVTVPYEAQGVYSNKMGTKFFRVPISGTVSYSVVKKNGEWKITGWNNDGPVYGDPVLLPEGAVDMPPVTDIGPSVAPTITLTQEQIDEINAQNERLYGNGGASPAPVESSSAQ